MAHSAMSILYIPVFRRSSFLVKKPLALIQLNSFLYEKNREMHNKIVVRKFIESKMILMSSLAP